MTRLRACWVAHAAVGCAMTPKTCTRRLAISITTSTYSRCSVTVSIWKKSVAKPGRLRPQERPPSGVDVAGRWADPVAAEDAADRAGTDSVAETDQFACTRRCPHRDSRGPAGG